MSETLMNSETFFSDLGGIFAKRCSIVLHAKEQQLGDVDKDALNFARFLKAARKSANLSLKQLAEKAELAEAEVFALEQGIIVSTEIKHTTLHKLAKVLDKDISTFALILQREIPAAGFEGMPAHVRNAHKDAKHYFGSIRNLNSALLLMLATLFSSIVFSLSKIRAVFPPPANLTQSISFTNELGATNHLLHISVTLIIVLLFILIWFSIRTEHPFVRRRIHIQNQQRLLYLTSIMLIIIFAGSTFFFKEALKTEQFEELYTQKLSPTPTQLPLALPEPHSIPVYMTEAPILTIYSADKLHYAVILIGHQTGFYSRATELELQASQGFDVELTRELAMRWGIENDSIYYLPVNKYERLNSQAYKWPTLTVAAYTLTESRENSPVAEAMVSNTSFTDDFYIDPDLSITNSHFWVDLYVHVNSQHALTNISPIELGKHEYFFKAYSVNTADVELDGNIDVIQAEFEPSANLNINQHWRLAPKLEWWEYTNSQTIAWGDYDEDGYLDLAGRNIDQSNKIYVDGNRMLAMAASWVSAESDSAVRVVWGDMDSDSDLDLAVGNNAEAGDKRLFNNESFLWPNSRLAKYQVAGYSVSQSALILLLVFIIGSVILRNGRLISAFRANHARKN